MRLVVLYWGGYMSLDKSSEFYNQPTVDRCIGSIYKRLNIINMMP